MCVCHSYRAGSCLRHGVPQVTLGGFNTQMVIHDLDDLGYPPWLWKPPYYYNYRWYLIHHGWRKWWRCCHDMVLMWLWRGYLLITCDYPVSSAHPSKSKDWETRKHHKISWVWWVFDGFDLFWRSIWFMGWCSAFVFRAVKIYPIDHKSQLCVFLPTETYSISWGHLAAKPPTCSKHIIRVSKINRNT